MRRFNTATLGASLAMIAGWLLIAPAAHAERYLVNGHSATVEEERLLVSYGFAPGAWRMSGWGISLDVAHTDFVPEPSPPHSQCCSVLGVLLDCDEIKIAAR